MPVITFVTSGGGTADVADNTNLLVASLRHKGGIPFKCGGGKCGSSASEARNTSSGGFTDTASIQTKGATKIAASSVRTTRRGRSARSG